MGGRENNLMFTPHEGVIILHTHGKGHRFLYTETVTHDTRGRAVFDVCTFNFFFMLPTTARDTKIKV